MRLFLGAVTMRWVLVSEVSRERGEGEAHGAPPGATRRVRLEGRDEGALQVCFLMLYNILEAS